MVNDNDTRGWVLTCLSGLACILGASIVCIDVIIRRIPRFSDFRLEESNSFLSCSLSLSSGVMLFSALYSMLPSAKESLQDGNLNSKAAAWILISTFMFGVFGIQMISKVVHRFIPSHAVDCHHFHDEESTQNSADHSPVSERSPLLHHHHTDSSITRRSPETLGPQNPNQPKRPSIHAKVTSTVADIMIGRNKECTADGPCFGFSEPCGQDCFKTIAARTDTRGSKIIGPGGVARPNEPVNMLTSPVARRQHSVPQISTRESTIGVGGMGGTGRRNGTHAHHHEGEDRARHIHDHSSQEGPAAQSPRHHHHVPQNAFLSISLQTSIAIALHKLPEGFITYATNHANPRLGFSVFVALFIHNLTEGFALALPIFLATSSRLRALLYSFLLGGLSQPLGAGLAALWLALAERGRGGGNLDGTAGETIYGAMFAATAGIMACVALSLFKEGLELSHNRDASMLCAFLGMGILGVSSALTA